MVRLLVLASAILAFNAFAAETQSGESPKNLIAWWKAGLGALHMQDNLSESRVAGLYASAKAKYRLADTVSSFAEVGVQLESGSSQQLFVEEFRPVQTVFLREANIRWAPLRYFNIRVGVLNQEEHENPLIFRNASFPAARESVLIPAGWLRLRLTAQQAVPTSQSLSTRTSAKKDGTPFVLTQSVFADFDYRGFFAEAHATYFEFRNLPPAVANESRFLGNTVSGTSINTARFTFDYLGWDFGGKVGWRRGSRELASAGAEYVNNNKGPVGDNTGLRAWGRFQFPVYGALVQPIAGYFRNESDSSPAFFNSKFLGHNNREGFFGGIDVKLPRYSFGFDAVTANTINTNALQADRVLVQLHLETRYNAL